MPNINEFLSEKEPEKDLSKLEKIYGYKPCSKCDKDAEYSLWDIEIQELTWTCPSGHSNSYRIN
mgnify:CR=1